jgi:hypothetical protein
VDKIDGCLRGVVIIIGEACNTQILALGKFHLNFIAMRRIDVIIAIVGMDAKVKLILIDSMTKSIITPMKLAEA